MAEPTVFNARLVRYLGLDRQFQVFLSVNRIRLRPQKGLRAVAGPASGYGAFLGGLVGALIGMSVDKNRSKSENEVAAFQAVANSPEDIVISKSSVSGSKLSAASMSGGALMEGRLGDWKLKLNSGKRYHFIFDDPQQMYIAVPAILAHLKGRIQVNAEWSDKHVRYVPAGRWLPG